MHNFHLEEVDVSKLKKAWSKYRKHRRDKYAKKHSKTKFSIWAEAETPDIPFFPKVKGGITFENK